MQVEVALEEELEVAGLTIATAPGNHEWGQSRLETSSPDALQESTRDDQDVVLTAGADRDGLVLLEVPALLVGPDHGGGADQCGLEWLGRQIPPYDFSQELIDQGLSLDRFGALMGSGEIGAQGSTLGAGRPFTHGQVSTTQVPAVTRAEPPATSYARVMDLPTAADVASAADLLEGVAHRTPVMTSHTLDKRLAAQVFFKCENFQRMGAFKFRGGYNAISRLSAAEKAGGVVAFSSGNHAQAIALAAQLHGVSATIVMPHDAPAVKVAATAGYGADLVRYDRYTEDRMEVAARVTAERGAVLIPPYNHPHVIAGQGTAAKELIEDAGPLDLLIAPLGGGGLLGGTALAAAEWSPGCQVYGAEPETGNDGQLSLQRGEIVTIETPHTIADGTQTTELGTLTFAILRNNGAKVVTATDDQIVESMRFLAERMKLVIEPSGASSLAGLLNLADAQSADPLAGKRIGVILSGGNVDLNRFASLVGTD